jgi:Heavy metal associated domain 2
MNKSLAFENGAAPLADDGMADAAAAGADKNQPSAPRDCPAARKHKARIEHKVLGRIRMRIPSGKTNPAVLEIYREAFSHIPGITTVKAKPATGNIIIHYDPRYEGEIEKHLPNYCAKHPEHHLSLAATPLPGDEIKLLANKIKAEADFFADRSEFAKTTVDLFRKLDNQLKVTTGNTVDLKIVLAGGLAVYTFWEIGANAATPMWVTLALFAMHHFAE